MGCWGRRFDFWEEYLHITGLCGECEGGGEEPVHTIGLS